MGQAVLMRYGDQKIFKLMTKARLRAEPRYSNLEASLNPQGKQCIELPIYQLMMLTIGCGFD